AAHLAVELDGGQHSTDAGQRDDAERTRYLESRGVRVLRFTNLDVRGEIDSVLLAIEVALGETPLPCPSPRGRGDARATARPPAEGTATARPSSGGARAAARRPAEGTAAARPSSRGGQP